MTQYLKISLTLSLTALTVALATLITFVTSEPIKLISNSWFLYLLFLDLECYSLQILAGWIFSSFRSVVKCFCLKGFFPDPLKLRKYSLPFSHQSFTLPSQFYFLQNIYYYTASYWFFSLLECSSMKTGSLSVLFTIAYLAA